MLVPCRRLRSPSSAPPPGGAPVGPPSSRGAGVLSLTGRAIARHLPAGSRIHGEANSWLASQRHTPMVRASVCPEAGERSLQASSIQNTANPRSDGDLQSSVQKRATQEGPRRAYSLGEGVIKSGGRLFATESSGGHKALLLYGGRAWLLQNLQLSPRKELCNLHREVCADRRGRGQREAAALRRGQSKLLSRKKKKKKPNQNTRRHRAHPSSRPPPDSGLAPKPRASLQLKARANRVLTPRDAQPMGPLDPPRPRSAREGLRA